MTSQAIIEKEDVNQHWERTEGGFRLKSDRCNWAGLDFLVITSAGGVQMMLDADNGAAWIRDHHVVHFLACRLQEAHVLAQILRMGWVSAEVRNGR